MQSAHRHSHGGGWVQNTAIVHPEAYIGEKAAVNGRAQLGPQVELRGASTVSGDVKIDGQVILDGAAAIKDQAHISGRLFMYGQTEISEDARIKKDARLFMRQYARLRGDAVIENGETHLSGAVVVAGQSRLRGNLSLNDAILVNAPLDGRPTAIIKGLIWMDFIATDPHQLWFCVEGSSLHYDTVTHQHSAGLDGLLKPHDFMLIEKFSDIFNKKVIVHS